MISLGQIIQEFDYKTPVVVPDDWLQGRTVYGGLTASLALQSALSVVPDLAPLRSASFAFIGPATPPLTFHPRILRAGKSVTSVAVEVVCEAGLATSAVMVFGQERQSEVLYENAEMPKVRSPLECAVWPPEMTPAFLRHFEVRQAGTALPLAQSKKPEFLVWCRHLGYSGVHPLVALVAMADCLPPAAMNFFKSPAPISSINWSFDVLEPVLDQDWFLLRSEVEQARDGYSVQDMEVWTEGGKRLLCGRQNVAIFA